MLEVYVKSENGENVLVLKTPEGEKEILRSDKSITRTYSPKKKRILAITGSEKIYLYNIDLGKTVLEIPLANVLSLEYARTEDGTKVAVAVVKADGKSKVYVVSGDQIEREESYDYPVTVGRSGGELKVERQGQ